MANRQIVLDTETTGLETSQGHRIIEIGCVELVGRKHTRRHYHQYINPEREVDEGALQVHGITDEFLADKPVFSAIVDDFIEYVDGAELIIHNAMFDVGFIDHELALLNHKLKSIVEICGIVDSLALARKKHPGQKNNLDALCKRYDVDNSNRELHGALLDSEILADVYLRMTGGQTALLLDAQQDDNTGAIHAQAERIRISSNRKKTPVLMPTEAEMEQHAQLLEKINRQSDGHCVWLAGEEMPFADV